jgi:hypothetical protein
MMNGAAGCPSLQVVHYTFVWNNASKTVFKPVCSSSDNLEIVVSSFD